MVAGEGIRQKELLFEQAANFDAKKGLQSSNAAFVIAIDIKQSQVHKLTNFADKEIKKQWNPFRIGAFDFFADKISAGRGHYTFWSCSGACSDITKNVLRLAGYNTGTSFVISTPTDLLKDFLNNNPDWRWNYRMIKGNRDKALNVTPTLLGGALRKLNLLPKK